LGVGRRFLSPPFRVAGLAFSQEAAALEPLHLQPIPNPRRYLTDTLRYGAKTSSAKWMRLKKTVVGFAL
jgi:hypothetical protein